MRLISRKFAQRMVETPRAQELLGRDRVRIGLPDLPEVRAMQDASLTNHFRPGTFSEDEIRQLKVRAVRAVAWHDGLGPEYERLHLHGEPTVT